MTYPNENNKSEKNNNIKKMAALLRDGNTLLGDACPQCNSPLFKLKTGEIVCASCDKKVIIIKNEAQVDRILQNNIIDDSIKVINMKIRSLQQEIDLEKDFDELYKLMRLFNVYLEALEKLQNLKLRKY